MAAQQPLDYKLVPAIRQPVRGLVVIFHGHGGNAEEFVSDAETLREDMPDVDFICLQGPETIAGEPDDYRTWINLDSARSLPKIALQLIFNRVPVLNRINAFIDEELKKRNLGNDRLGLMGLSLGAGVALTAGMARKEKCAGIVSHSGVYYRYPYIKSRPDALVIMGDQDELYERSTATGLKGIFERALGYQHEQTITRLQKAGIVFEEKIVPGLGHTINGESLRHASAFLKKKLA